MFFCQTKEGRPVFHICLHVVYRCAHVALCSVAFRGSVFASVNLWYMIVDLITLGLDGFCLWPLNDFLLFARRASAQRCFEWSFVQRRVLERSTFRIFFWLLITIVCVLYFVPWFQTKCESFEKLLLRGFCLRLFALPNLLERLHRWSGVGLELFALGPRPLQQ